MGTKDGNRIPIVKITTIKELERELASLAKAFAGKETEANWEAREKAILQLRALIQAKSDEWRITLAKAIHDLTDAITKAIQSLRTTLALEALKLTSDIAQYLGRHLDAYTTDQLLMCLIRLAGSAKKIMASSSLATTTTFLSSTPYRQKVMQHLHAMLNEKNSQVRHAGANYLKTVVESHSTSPSMGRPANLDLLDKCLKKGLQDATPMVKDLMRQIFAIYETHWPDRATNLAKTLDNVTQRQLSQVTTAMATSSAAASISNLPRRPASAPRTKISKTPTVSYSSTSPSLSRLSSGTSSSRDSTSSIPGRTPSTTSTTSTASSDSKPSLIPRRTTSSSVKNSAPSSSRSGQSTLPQAAPPRDRTSSFNMGVASSLHMLRSNDNAMKCRGIRNLSEKLRQYPHDPRDDSLPSSIPSKADLAPIILGYLTDQENDRLLHETLMSWDSLAGLFLRALRFEHYAAPLLWRCHSGDAEEQAIYQRGIQKLKLLLARSDPDLAERLLERLVKVNHEQHDPQKKDILCVGFLEWMDELVCDFVGLGSEPDPELLADIGGAHWSAMVSGESVAALWFDDKNNAQRCLSELFPWLDRIDDTSPMYAALMTLVGRLRLANERVFESLSPSYPRAMAKLSRRPFELDDLDSSLGTIRLEDLPSGTFEGAEEEDSMMMMMMEEEGTTGATQDMANIQLAQQDMITDLSVDCPINDKKKSARSPPGSPDDTKGLGQIKRRRRGASLPQHPEGQVQLIRDTLEAIKDRSVDALMLVQLGRLSAATKTPESPHNPHTLWTPDIYLDMVECLIQLLSSTVEFPRNEAISLTQAILTNQGDLLAICPPTSQTRLSQALLDLMENETTIEVQETLTLLSMQATDPQVIWGLLRGEKDSKKQAFLYSLVGKQTASLPKSVLRDSLNNRGGARILLQGFNHPDSAVRRSSVQALVGVQQSLGDEYMKKYVTPWLRKDQMTLLQQYVGQYQASRPNDTSR
ncbi:clasp N terminal-domain-containing protein [Syncephalastrum racemosum]|uniref:Clasp N terminal-domain-containing protein n=1 Tax=Syncephalastrum racemosum TaxID=13706 RepID=A0A1X2HQX5_SYNRA|nr:clasp N terminal-domain-containing protein [Syncephalastrum racemosum]